MYIESLRLKNVRTFVDETLTFVHPDADFRPRKRTTENGALHFTRPRLPNVNLLLGDNGSGKSTVLRAIAMAALGPSFEDSRLSTQGLVRRDKPHRLRMHGPREDDSFFAGLLLHEQDGTPGKRPFPAFLLTHRGELERVNYVGDPGDNKLWEPVFESNNDAFFAVGYGATRRVEAPENLDMAARTRMTFLRGQRLQGLFQESFTLIPLETWLPAMRDRKPGRYQEVETLLSTLLKPGHCRFTGDQERQVDYLFEFAGARIPFRWMSDGYRASSSAGWATCCSTHARHVDRRRS